MGLNRTCVSGALGTSGETAVELVPYLLPSPPPLSVLFVELQPFAFLEVQRSVLAVPKNRGSTIHY